MVQTEDPLFETLRSGTRFILLIRDECPFCGKGEVKYSSGTTHGCEGEWRVVRDAVSPDDGADGSQPSVGSKWERRET